MTKKSDKKRILEKIKRYVCLDYRYIISQEVVLYKEEGLADDEDIIFAIRNAEKIDQIEKDEKKKAIDGNKYIINSHTKYGFRFYTVWKVY